MGVIVVGNCRSGKIALVEAVMSFQYSIEELVASTGKSIMFVNELNVLAEEIKQTIIYEKPQSKFISRPRNNFRKR
jgi:hypothetical protein